ncbi:MAG: ribonuclease H-like domain-containing protein [Thermoprotei archaeon]|nr:ribonuclease H-like domain-containing protein [Thermoprotei archaeon]
MDVYRVYLDIETYSPKGEPDFHSDKVIAIGFKSLTDADVTVFKEWEDGERVILEKFLGYIEGLKDRGLLELVGFNILRFDIPFIISRAYRHGLGGLEDLYYTLLRDIFAIDLLQCLLPYNNFRYAGLSALNIALRLSMPFSEYRSEEIAEFYDNKEYDKIVSHVKSDVLFTEHLDRALRLKMFFEGMISFESRKPQERL